MLTLGIFFVALAAFLIWNLYTQGLYDLQALIVNISEGILFICIEITLFIMLININLDFTL